MTTHDGIRVHVDGIVQGVGFRPFVFGLAHKHRLFGWVKNTSAGVDIELDGDKQELNRFLVELKEDTPALAHITNISVTLQPAKGYSDFKIIESEVVENAFQPISPDVCTCPDCLREMMDKHARRYHYPFINCTNCGPRFTIIKDIPYDRESTSMAGFKMCPDCEKEYRDPLNRRFHAQPVACPECGPRIWLEIEPGIESFSGEAALIKTQELLANGKVLAIKGLGGFHLACDANNEVAVSELRRRKLRVDKPFALMMPDLKAVREYCDIDEETSSLLQSKERPILLLDRKPDATIAKSVAPGQKSLGVMLPYTPLHSLLFVTDLYDALVMTSGNLSEEPIVTDNAKARTQLKDLADAFLMHDRDIYIRSDDSVARLFEGQVMPIRRSRGYAPFPVHLDFTPPVLLACGAELKNTFCLTQGNYAFLSHHIGDLENLETLESFEQGITHFEKLFRAQITGLAYDLHPDYLASRYALKRAETQNLPAVGVQHHHAHIAACMADNQIPRDQPVIGVAYDGTGFGEDGTLWGGEFLFSKYHDYTRPFHLQMMKLVGGDLAVRHPWRIALELLDQYGIPWDDHFACVQAIRKDSQAERIFKQQAASGINTQMTSSMGRLFDAVASLAGVKQLVNYEAQAAIELENLVDPQESGWYEFGLQNGLVDPGPMLSEVVRDLHLNLPVGKIAARFHNGVAHVTWQVCREIRSQTQCQVVALSGGVWQNMTLLKACLALLRSDGFIVLIHRQVPTNDGGLALGQAMVAAAKLERGTI